MRDWADLLGVSNVKHRSLLTEMEQEEFLNLYSLVTTVDIRRTINTERENISSSSSSSSMDYVARTVPASTRCHRFLGRPRSLLPLGLLFRVCFGSLVLSILSRWLIQFLFVLALTSCIPEISSSFLLNSLMLYFLRSEAKKIYHYRNKIMRYSYYPGHPA